jgi:toxin-antitoxin system PIN domain toxin
MRALLDVNVLIALLDANHVSHHAACSWFAEHATLGWASCAITQNGCVRIMAHPGYPNARPVAEVAQRLRVATAQSIHEFWAESVSVLDTSRIDPTRIHGPRQLTDVYLLALAVAREGRLVTFDRSLAVGAVVGATNAHLVVL